MCGESAGTCSTGTASFITNVSGNVSWICEGVNGGLSADCAVGGGSCAAPNNAGWPLAVSTNAFYVATNGNDGNPGTLAAPFATLQRAQQAMEGSVVKTTYIRAGTYSLAGGGLNLTSADNGETWMTYPDDPIDSAILDGGITGSGQGAGNVGNGVIYINGGSNITIDGLTVQNFQDWGILIQGEPGDDADGNTVENCQVLNGYTDLSSATGGIGFNITYEGSGVGQDRVQNTTIANNYISNIGRNGISGYGTPMVDSYQGDLIENNVILNTVQNSSDEGAIYIWSSNQQPTPGSVTITNNFIRDYGAASYVQDDGSGAFGIYLDNGMNGASIIGNVVGPTTAGADITNDADILNNCDDQPDDRGGGNIVDDNILDMGTSSRQSAFLGCGDTAGETFIQSNIIISNFAGGLNTGNGGVFSDDPDTMVDSNVYWNYGGGAVVTSGQSVGDIDPVIENPQIAGYYYSIATNSPVFSSPVNFMPITGGWGPPGFVIPSSTNISSPATGGACPAN